MTRTADSRAGGTQTREGTLMRIESRDGDTTLYLERGERHEDRVVGQNCVHAIFNATGRKIYTYVDVGAAAAPFRPRVWIRGRDSFVGYALSGDWRRGARVAS
jgi:hypothetical protein